MMRRCTRNVISLAALSLIAACSEATAPKSVTLSITSSTPGWEIQTSANGLAVMTCTPTIVLTADGNTDAEITGGVLRFYAGPDRSTSSDTIPLGLDDLERLFRTTEVKAGSNVTTRIIFSDGLPFEMDLSLHYMARDGGAKHDAMMHMICGPTPAQSSSAPQLTSTTTTSHQPLQPGDTIYIKWNASDSQGLWETAYHISGIIDSTAGWAQHFVDAASGTIVIPIPSSAPLGDVDVDMAVVNGGGYTVQRRVAAFYLVDATPPTITLATLWDKSWQGTYQGLVGQVAAGDSLPLTVGAVDNSRPAWMIYQVTGPSTLRDSVAIPAGATNDAVVKVSPVIGPELVGASRLTVWVRDKYGNLSDSVASAPDSFRVYPTITPPSVRGALPYASTIPAFDVRRGELLTAGAGAMTIYSLDAGAIIDSVSLGSASAGIDLLPGGDSAAVALPQRHGFGIVDLTQPSHPLTTITIPQLDTFPGAAPVRVTGTGNGKVLLWLNAPVNGNLALSYDLASGTSSFTARCNYSWLTSGSEIAPSGDRMHVLIGSAGEEMVYDVASGTCTPTRLIGDPLTADYPYGSAEPAGSRFTFGATVLNAQGDSVWTLTHDRGGYPPMVLVDSTHLWTRQGAGVSLLDLTTGLFASHVRVPFDVRWLLLSPDGRTLVAIGASDAYNQAPVPVMRIDLTGT